MTMRTLDRERSGPELRVPVVLSDAGGVSGTVYLTVMIADENDNIMKSAEKHVQIIRIAVSLNFYFAIFTHKNLHLFEFCLYNNCHQ